MSDLPQRRESSTTITNTDGVPVTVRALEGITAEDILLHLAKAVLYKRVTGTDLYPGVPRDIKNTLVRIIPGRL